MLAGDAYSGELPALEEISAANLAHDLADAQQVPVRAGLQKHPFQGFGKPLMSVQFPAAVRPAAALVAPCFCSRHWGSGAWCQSGIAQGGVLCVDRATVHACMRARCAPAMPCNNRAGNRWRQCV